MNRTCICLCTFRRPRALRKQLRRIRDANLPADTLLVVVDNACDPQTGEIVNEEAPQATLIYEPRRGIPFARNTALEAGLSFGADLFALIDDDDPVDHNWLVELLRTYAISHPHVVYGCSRDVTNHIKATRATHNVLLSKSCLDLIGAPYFDERFPLSGGTDTLFFNTIDQHGGSFARAWDSIVYRPIASYRKHRRAVFWHHFKLGQNEILFHVNGLHRRSKASAITGLYWRLAKHSIKFVLRWHRRKTREKLVILFAKAIGGTYAFFGRRYDYYADFTAEHD